MKNAFIIMQIGNTELDAVYREVIAPAAISCGFDPKRVDKHNKGGLLKSEIVNFIQSSDIIIADLTNERPNCYLEVGFAMGLGKFANLILTAREDHNPDSPNHKRGGSKIHFDLIGYDILFWNPENLDEFKTELEKRINRRLGILSKNHMLSVSLWDQNWILLNQEKAIYGLKSTSKQGFMEIRATLPNSILHVEKTDLLNVAKGAQIYNFGWPIGAVLDNENQRPKPIANGIVTEIMYLDGKHYDYWTLRTDGSFYLLKSLFEDEIRKGYLFFDTRIVRIAEALLYLKRLYSNLNVQNNSMILIGIRHGGLKNRILGSAGGRLLHSERQTIEDEVYTEIETTIEEIESDLVNVVHKYTKEIFELFDFFEVSKETLGEIINDFITGKVR